MDVSGRISVVPIEFRFITGDLSPRLSDVTYSSFDLRSEDIFEVNVKYDDAPFNIRTNSDGTPQDERLVALFNDPTQTQRLPSGMQASIRLKDGVTGELIDEGVIDFITKEGSYKFDAPRDTLFIEVEVDLKQNSEITDSFSETININTLPYKNIFDRLWNEYRIASIILIFVLAGTLTVLLVRMRGRKISNKLQ